MPSKTLARVQKQITKKKGSKALSLNANSRDSHRLQRASARDDKLARLVSARDKANKPYLDRTLFFQALALAHPAAFTAGETDAAAVAYLSRHDAELAALQAGRRPGRPAAAREELLRRQRDRERREHAAGLWMPDLADAANVARLAAWAGGWVGLGTVAFVRVQDGGASRASAWPPKGGA